MRRFSQAKNPPSFKEGSLSPSSKCHATSSQGEAGEVIQRVLLLYVNPFLTSPRRADYFEVALRFWIGAAAPPSRRGDFLPA